MKKSKKYLTNFLLQISKKYFTENFYSNIIFLRSLKKFRKEIFNAHKYFSRKISQPEILINKWKGTNREIIICKMKNKSNAVKDYFEYILEIRSESEKVPKSFAIISKLKSSESGREICSK